LPFKIRGKASMKIISGTIGVLVLLGSSVSSFAVDQLKISVQGQNTILQWSSINTETYIVQYATNLDSPIMWQTLTDFYPASVSGNITYFTNFNSVFYPDNLVGGGSGGGDINPLDDSGEIMVIANNGQGGASPLAIYPIGFDLSNFTIFNSKTGESVSGKNYVIKESQPAGGGVQPMDDIGSTNQNAAFYRVVRDGAWIVGLTNGAVLSGVVTLPVELGNASGTLDTLSITETNSPVGGSIQSPPNFAPLAMKLDTTQMANGVHYISVYAHWSDTNGGAWEANSPTISITTSNEITFENWMPYYGDLGNTVLFDATSAHASTDWILSVYDDHTNYLGYFSGHTDNGDIGVYWDYSGTPYTNSQFFIFELATEYIDPPSPKTWKQNDPWIATGAWAMAIQHAWDSARGSDILYTELSGFATGALSNGGAKPPLGGDQQPYALSFQDASEATTWANFKTALYDPATRNLVYFGHGGGNGLGNNQGDPNVSISCQEIQAHLHTVPDGQPNRHAFRFVFLDGCSTAAGNLPQSFGILHRENVDSAFYIHANLRRSCFVGWTADKYIGFISGGIINTFHTSYIQYIQTDMSLNGADIGQALFYASLQPNMIYVNTTEFKIYGSQEVTLQSQNN
jgi:hypothetical protein